MRFKDLTEYHIELLSDPSKYNPDIASELNIGIATVTRWRRKLKIPSFAGRKSIENGGVYEKRGEYKECKMCDNDVYYTPKELIDNDIIKCCSKSCYFSDPEYQERMKYMDRSYMRKPGWASWLYKDDTPEYKKYRHQVSKITEKNYKKYIDIINPNRHPRTLCGVEYGWQLDHIKSVRECFDEGLTPKKASELSNLRMLPWLDNLMRNYN